MFLFIVLVICFSGPASGILVSTENRLATRNITCQHGSLSSTILAFNCEACLITSRNYVVDTTLSLTGPGPAGISYACIRVEEVEAYHENLVRECRYFPRETLQAFDDFCIASPFNQVRGSYRACMCVTNICNVNYTQCTRPINPYRDRPAPPFKNTIVELTRPVQCYRSYEDDRPPIYSALAPLCSIDDDVCYNYLADHSVLCAMNVDRNNRITRQRLPASIYAAYLLKFKTRVCRSFTWRSKSISFSDCDQESSVCMCSQDGCDRDLETCRTSDGRMIQSHRHFSLLLLVLLRWV